MDPFNRSLDSLAREYFINTQSDKSKYIISFSDERRQDTLRITTEQLGRSIILLNRDLLKHSITRPIYGCDGTFNKVSKLSCVGMDFELFRIIEKDDSTGKCYAVIRHMAFGKTKPAGKDFLKTFLNILCNHGLENHLEAH